MIAVIELGRLPERMVSDRAWLTSERVRQRTAAWISRTIRYRRVTAPEPDATRRAREAEHTRGNGVLGSQPQRIQSAATAVARVAARRPDRARSKRSRFITLSQAATKSRANFSFQASLA